MIMRVTAVITLRDDCDPQEVFENMDYNFSDPAIVNTELTDVEVETPTEIRDINCIIKG